MNEPCLGCSLGALVNIPGCSIPQWITEFKCPYTAQSLISVEAATSNSNLFFLFFEQFRRGIPNQWTGVEWHGLEWTAKIAQ